VTVVRCDPHTGSQNILIIKMNESEEDFMRMQNIAAVGVQVTAIHPSDTIQVALERVRLGELGNIVSGATEVGDDAESFAIPTQHLGSAARVDHAQRDEDHKKHDRYPNEFLG